MLKQAFRSYAASLHPRNIKKVKNGSADWLIYWLFVWPIMISPLGDDSGKSSFYAITEMIPFAIMSWSNISSRCLMSKQMYLCPMKRKDREEYVNYILYFKIGFPVLVGLCIDLIWSAFIGFNLYRTLVHTFIYLSVGIAIYICIDGKGWADRNITWGRRGQDGKMKWALMNMISFAYGLFILFGIESTDTPAQMDLISNLFVNTGLLLMAIFNVFIIRTQYKDVIEQAGDYEEAFRILGKVKPEKYDLFAK